MNLSCKNLNNLSPFGIMPKGEEISQFTLCNSHGMTLKLINYGATLISVKVPTKSGSLVELTLGFDTLEEYLQHPYYFGCTVGRVANRISFGTFLYQDKSYQLACNENKFSHLHGGQQGFDKVIWQGNLYSENNGSGVEFFYHSKNEEENYPGNLSVKTNYFLGEDNSLKILYTATTDQATPVNLTNHAYWNLAGAGMANILNHEMQIFSDAYLMTNPHHIPTGEVKAVAGTDYDFRLPHLIGERIQSVGGYDNFYVLNPEAAKNFLAAQVIDPISQRQLKIYTTAAGLQFYTGNYLVDHPIAEGKRTNRWGGFCLETQGFPDAVNHKNFPNIILPPGSVYQQETIYQLIF